MSTLFAATRALHFVSAIVVFGALAFCIFVAGSVWRSARDSDGGSAIAYRFVGIVAPWAIAAALVSGGAWLLLEAATIGGVPLVAAVDRNTLERVAVETTFGRVWTLRFAMLVVLALLLWTLARASDRNRRVLALLAAFAAAAYLATLACAGHAAAGMGSDEPLQIAADVAHLLAAGAWLGALPALVYFLTIESRTASASQATRRFSNLGLACVFALIASGVVNAWYLVGSVPALVGTGYGKLLLVKLGLFATMLVLAVVNRGRIAPRLGEGDVRARHALARNAALETAAGIGVVGVVAVLGTWAPAIHEAPDWPLAFTLSLDPVEGLPWKQLAFATLAAVAAIGVLALVKGALERPPRLHAMSVAAMLLPLPLLAWLLGVPAHPTTYWVSPVGYEAEAIASGKQRYAARCADCHAPDGSGARRGNDAASVRGASTLSLVERVPVVREGDLYWAIAHGVAGTAMPAFAPSLGETDVWNLIQYLDAQAAARNAIAVADRVRPLKRVLAPDFAFERVGEPQEFYARRGDERVTLLVFYTMPQSLPRMRELERQAPALRAAGARIIALPMSVGSVTVDTEPRASGASIYASASPAVASVYAMFARTAEDEGEPAPAHVEFLADRYRDLRVRWIGASDPVERSADTLRQVDILAREPPRAPLAWGHRH